MYWPFDEQKMKSIFNLAGIAVLKCWRLPNRYWNDRPDANAQSPWWLVKTQFGLIEIGARKRVLNIDWSDTEVQAEVTEENVTKGDHHVHAWTELKAVEYLQKFKAKAEQS